MSTIQDKEYTSNFSGLSSTAITAIVFITVSLVLEGTLKRLRRYSAEDAARKAGDTTVRDRGMEQWAMGYLFRARTFVSPAPTTKDYSHWPLVWIWTAIRTQESWFETHCGPDATAYVRFLRGAWWWLLLLLCTVFPVLTSINFVYSPKVVSTSSIERASISSLIQSNRGLHLLWVHVICIWFVTFSWIVMLAWFGYGVIRIRRNSLREQFRLDASDQKQQTVLQEKPSPQSVSLPSTSSTADPGWRFRTVLMRNIPEAMRSERAIREYFELYLRGAPSKANGSSHSTPPQTPATSKPFPNLSLQPEESFPLIDEIVLVRKQGELNDQWRKYQEALWQLEACHVVLAQNVMAWVKAKTRAQRRRQYGEETGKPVRPWWRWWRTQEEKEEDKCAADAEKEARPGDDVLLDAYRVFLTGGTPPSDEKTGEPKSIWAVLHDTDPVLLDRFQPLFKLKHFRGQAVPAIDYWTAKLNLAQRLIEEHRSRPDSCEPASTALVTFSTAADARRARLELSSRPGTKRFGRSAFDCKTSWAPEFRDLDWNKLVFMSLSSDIIRSLILNIFIWTVTLIWILPISFLVGLLSLSSIAKYFPGLAVYLQSNPALNSLFSNLLPTAIVALLGMLVPTLIGILTRNGQTFVTESRLLLEVQARYWKWMIFNILLVFCVGRTAFTAFLNAFKEPESILSVIADAFPTAGSFFVSWSLLVIGIHHGVQHALLGIPYINHATVRKVKAPRKREFESLPRHFSYFYWIPNHLLVLAVTALFTILQPMVIPFNFAYFSFANVVFKNQFAHVYWRRHFELNGRPVFTRLFRYSLDSFLVAQLVAVAFFEVLKQYRLGAAVIPLLPITVFTKLIGTRLFNLLMDEIDEVEATLACEESTESLDMTIPLGGDDAQAPGGHHRFATVSQTVKFFATETVPALALGRQSRLHPGKAPSSASHFRSNRSHMSPSIAENRSPTSMESSRPMLGLAAMHSRDSSTESAPAENATTMLLAKSPGNAKREAAGLDLQLRLLTIHPPVLRDDRPVSNLRYYNPAVVQPLARSLWLPRDPLLPVDLGDTIDFHGRVLVSSEGGRGILGDWDEQVTQAEAEGAVTITGPRSDSPVQSLGRRSEDHLDDEIFSPTSRLLASYASHDGTERIQVASEIATRIEEDVSLQSASPPPKRRRGTASSGGSFTPTMGIAMRRRNTGASNISNTGNSLMLSNSPQPSPSLLSAPQSSPTLHRHPLETRAPPPAIPSFGTPGNSAILSTSPERERNLSVDVFSAAQPRATRSSSNASLGNLSPGTPTSPRATASSPRAIRVSRSGSILSHTGGRNRSPSTAGSAMGMRLASVLSRTSMAEEDEGEEQEVVHVSQAEALRSELLEEERIEHEKRVARDKKRSQTEKSDKKSGWLTRALVGSADNSAVQEES